MEYGEGNLNQPILDSMQTGPAAERGNGSHHGVDCRLEKVLSDTQLAKYRRLWLASCIELRLLFRLAAPAVFVYLINNAMSLSTRVFCGHLGNLELAAASLGNGGIQLFAYGLMVRFNPRRSFFFFFFFLTILPKFNKFVFDLGKFQLSE